MFDQFPSLLNLSLWCIPFLFLSKAWSDIIGLSKEDREDEEGFNESLARMDAIVGAEIDKASVIYFVEGPRAVHTNCIVTAFQKLVIIDREFRRRK